MAVPGPPVNLLSARGEFSLGAGGLLQLLRAPGGVVPNTAPNSGVPQSAPIGLLSLAGAQATVPPSVNINGGNMNALTISPADATSGYQLTSAGAEQEIVNGPATTFNTWLLSGAASDYEVMATLNSGTLASGTTGSWLSLGSTRAWTVQRTSNTAGTNSASLTIQIRTAVGGTLLDTAAVTLNATVDV